MEVNSPLIKSVIGKYFPDCTERQKEQFVQLEELILDWNSKINLVSRRDTSDFFTHHILHSLSIAKFLRFKPNSKVIDIGTGGGFPGLPLAILFPEVWFDLIDARAKKIGVVSDVIQKLGLANATADHSRIEDWKEKNYDFAVSRAVTDLKTLLSWARPKISRKNNNALPNGLICLKGGNLDQEIKAVGNAYHIEKTPIQDYFDFDYFENKYVLYVPI